MIWWRSKRVSWILEFKEALKEFKKHEKSSEGGENSVNGDEKKGEVFERDGNSEEEEEGGKTWARRVELPTFEGIDPQGWVSRAEKFFEVQNVSTKEKLKLAFISMEGGANHWFKFWRKKNLRTSRGMSLQKH